MSYRVTIERIETVSKEGREWAQVMTADHPLMERYKAELAKADWSKAEELKKSAPKEFDYVKVNKSETVSTVIYRQELEDLVIVDVVKAVNEIRGTK